MFWQIAGIIVLMVIILYILTVWLVLPNLLEHRLENYQNQLAQRQLEETRSTYREMRGWRHDYHNHMQILKAYLEKGEVDKCSEYLLEMDQDLNDIDQMVKTGNTLADAILNSKLSLARTKEIQLNVTAQIPEGLPLSDTEFCVVLGNLMDNAIEACEKIDKEGRFIRIYIGLFKKQFYLSVTNSTGHTKRMGQYVTKKGSGHGFGLYRIDKIVKKHQGYLNRKDEPGVFATELMLPMMK